MSKARRIMALVTAGAAVLSMAACGAGGGANGAASGANNDPKANDNAQCQNTVKKKGVEKVTLWAWYPAVEKVVDNFNEAHDDVQVCWTNVGNGSEAYKKFNTALKAKSGAPDVMQVEAEILPSYVSGAEKHLVDISQFGADKEKSKYTAGSWNDVTLGGGKAVYAIPSDAGPFAMMYRKDIFDKYGVKVPTTWDEYAKAGKELKEKGFPGHIGNYAPNGTAMNVALFAQKNVKAYDYDVSNPEDVGIDLTSTEVKDVMSYWQNLVKEGIVSTDDCYSNDWYTKIVDGSYATVVNASWLIGYVKGVSGAQEGAIWQVADAPKWDDSTPMVNQGGSTLAVTDQAKHTEAAAKVAIGLWDSDKNQEVAVKDSGNFPVMNSKLESDDFINYEEPFLNNQKVNDVLAPIAQGYKGYSFLPFQTYAYDEQTKAFTKIVRDGADVSSTMADLQKTLEDYAGQQGFTVKK